MDNLFCSGSAGLLSLPLTGSGGEGPKPLLKSTSLSRLDELQQYLRQCEDQQYKRKYFKMLSSCPADVLEDYAKQLKNRAVWLATEEQREYKRAKLLNVMGAAPAPGAHAAGDADAFCSQVLLRGEEGQGHYPDDECITPHNNARTASRLHGARQQQQQQQQQSGDAKGSQGRLGSVRGGGAATPALPGRLFKQEEGGTDLFSPLTHISVMDHHLQRISPLPASLVLHGEPSFNRRSSALQAQLDTAKPALQ